MKPIPPELGSVDALLSHLGVKAGEAKFLKLHRQYRYSEVQIPKRRGGARTLLVPERRLKYVQRRLLPLLEKLYFARRPVHGFVKGRGVISNAQAHERRPYLINLDLSDFFGTITRRRVHSLLQRIGLSEEVARTVCILCVVRNQLPQGAPTSPILANMICFRLDREMMNFAKDNRFRYTRYADDITISSHVLPHALFEGDLPSPGKLHESQLADRLRFVIQNNGFEIHPEKIWYSGQKSRKSVTGLVVNELVNVPRAYVRNLRASIYKIERMGLIEAEKEFKTRYPNTGQLLDVVRGRLEWIAQVRGRGFGPFQTLGKRFNKLFPDRSVAIDPTFQEVLEKAVWVVEFAHDPGPECAQGTAFFLQGVGLVCADHVFEKLPAGKSSDLYLATNPAKKYSARPSARRCKYRDLVILEHDVPEGEFLELVRSTTSVAVRDEIAVFGFPNFQLGSSRGELTGTVTGTTTKSGVGLLEVSAVLDKGLSGGPVVDARNQVIAVVHSGGYAESKQLATRIGEIDGI